MAVSTSKVCPRCKREFPRSEFGVQSYCRPCQAEYGREWRVLHPKPPAEFLCEHCGSEYTAASGRQKFCKACVPDKAARNRILRYGISQEQYDDMYSRQAGRCPICGRLASKMNVDHDHTTGRVRGLLCNYCNPALNLIENHLQAALTYLGIPSDRKEDH